MTIVWVIGTFIVTIIITVILGIKDDNVDIPFVPPDSGITPKVNLPISAAMKPGYQNYFNSGMSKSSLARNATIDNYQKLYSQGLMSMTTFKDKMEKLMKNPLDTSTYADNLKVMSQRLWWIMNNLNDYCVHTTALSKQLDETVQKTDKINANHMYLQELCDYSEELQEPICERIDVVLSMATNFLLYMDEEVLNGNIVLLDEAPCTDSLEYFIDKIRERQDELRGRGRKLRNVV